MMWKFLKTRRFSTNATRSEAYLPIADFYAGKSVFITGGTGFLGKVFIQRILDTCNELDKIFVLVREKNAASIEERVHSIVTNPIFSKLNKRRPEVLKKIIPIVGDLRENKLGIKFEDAQMLAEKVSVVFHAAATVKFNERLRVAMSVNVEGTKRVLELSKRMKDLQAFVYVSTAYSNTDKDVIEEVVYPPPADIDRVNELLQENIDEADARMKILMTSIAKAPLPGWLDNWYGATELIYNIGAGHNRVVPGDGLNVTDLIPVDYVVNLSIVAAARSRHRSNKLTVYNSTTSSVNPLTSGKVYQVFINETIKGGTDLLHYPMVFYSKSKMMVNLMTFLLMTAPAFIADLSLFMTGKLPRHLETTKNVIILRDALNFFAINTWLMKSDNTRLLSGALSASDRQQFPCDPSDIDWTEYLKLYSYGVRKYLKPRHKNMVEKCENAIDRKTVDKKIIS